MIEDIFMKAFGQAGSQPVERIMGDISNPMDYRFDSYAVAWNGSSMC